MLVAIEAFVDAEQGIGQYSEAELLRRFGEFVDELGTQPVTITISSLVGDMLDSYADVTHGLHGFSWKRDLAALIEEFIYTRECFFYPPNRAPVLEASFAVLNYRHDELDIDIHYSWNPPFVDFIDLCNVVPEGKELRLKPTFNFRPHRGILAVSAEYYVGPSEGWLHWNEDRECFHGIVPPRIASRVGAERFEAYTVPLELTARITKHFPGFMRFERLIRCALPLTVKRRPSICAPYEELVASPRIARPTGSRTTKEKSDPYRTPEQPERMQQATIRRIERGTLARPPLMRSPLKRANRQPRPPPSTPMARAVSDEHQENDQLSMEELHKLMERKAQNTNPPSPIRLNSLTLARFHEAMSLAHPPPSLTDVEVRTVHRVSHGNVPASDDKENISVPRTPKRPVLSGHRLREMQSPATTEAEGFSEINFGATHINRHGKLASQSESDREEKSSVRSVISPPTRNITPPVPSLRASASQRKRGKRPVREIESPTRRKQVRKDHVEAAPVNQDLSQDSKQADGAQVKDIEEADITCYTCAAHGCPTKTVTRDGETGCLSCQESSLHDLMGRLYQSRPIKDKQVLWHKLVGNDLEGFEPLIQRHDSALSNHGESHVEAMGGSSRYEGHKTADEWQATIRRNFREFQAKKDDPEKLDVTMEDVADSEESPSFASVL